MGQEYKYAKQHDQTGVTKSLIATFFRDCKALNVHQVWCEEGTFPQCSLPL